MWCAHKSKCFRFALIGCPSALHSILRYINLSIINEVLYIRVVFSFPFQLTRVLRNFNITKISDLELISNTTDRLDITFHFFGIKGDSQRIRDVITRMVERGRIGNFTLVSNYHHFDENPPLNMLVSKNCRNTFIWLIRTVAGLTNEWQRFVITLSWYACQTISSLN